MLLVLIASHLVVGSDPGGFVSGMAEDQKTIL